MPEKKSVADLYQKDASIVHVKNGASANLRQSPKSRARNIGLDLMDWNALCMLEKNALTAPANADSVFPGSIAPLLARIYLFPVCMPFPALYVFPGKPAGIRFKKECAEAIKWILPEILA